MMPSNPKPDTLEFRILVASYDLVNGKAGVPIHTEMKALGLMDMP